jgi:hypothetical protein
MRVEYIRFMGEVKSTETTIELEFTDGILSEVGLEIVEDYNLVRTTKLECRNAELGWVSEVVDKCYDAILDLAERVLPEFRTLKIYHRRELRREL